MDKLTIKLVQSLSQKKYRDEYDLFVVEGEKLVEELLHSDFVVRQLYYTAGTKMSPPLLRAATRHKTVDAEQVGEAAMQRLSGLKTPPAILAVAQKPSSKTLPALDKNELYLALDTVQDPGNLGTIIRIADWFGIRCIFCSPGTADCFNPKVVQATMGAIFRVHLHYTGLPEWLRQAKKEMPVYGTFLDGENMYQTKLASGGIIVMGNEGNGISDDVAAIIPERLFIPPYPAGAATSESLNVAVSTAIVCAEFRRQNYSM